MFQHDAAWRVVVILGLADDAAMCFNSPVTTDRRSVVPRLLPAHGLILHALEGNHPKRRARALKFRGDEEVNARIVAQNYGTRSH